MNTRRCRYVVALLGMLVAEVAVAQAPLGQPADQEIKVVTTKLGGDVYGIDGQGGRMAALVGPEGVFLVDSQFARVSDKIVAALKELSPAPLKLLVNTHVHLDHTVQLIPLPPAHTDGDTAVKF